MTRVQSNLNRLLIAALIAGSVAGQAGGIVNTWVASDPAKQAGMPGLITLDPSGSALFGRLQCSWTRERLSLDDRKYCSGDCSNERIAKAVISCGADAIRLYCMDDCSSAVVSVDERYGKGKLYFTVDHIKRSGIRPTP